PSMKRVMRSAMAPRATRPATPTAIPSTVNRYPRGQSARQVIPRSLPQKPRLDRSPAAPSLPSVDAHEEEEQLEGEPHAERDAQKRAARQHTGHAVDGTGDIPRLEERVEKRRLVVVPDEADERVRAVPETALVAGEPRGVEAVLAKRAEDLGRRQLG